MAVLRSRGKTITDPAEVKAYLAENGIEYAVWGVERVPTGATPAQLLDLYKPELDALIAKNGYLTSDTVALSPQTPKLDDILAVFKREHYHTDDEVRFIASGRGVFHLKHKAADDYYACEVHPGDLIVVPANTWHFFELCQDRSIAAIRVFKTKEGWVANFAPA